MLATDKFAIDMNRATPINSVVFASNIRPVRRPSTSAHTFRLRIGFVWR
jgi:hypothetical protein